MYTITHITHFLKTHSIVTDINEDDDLVKDLHLNGDDFHDAIDAYAKQFGVDMSSYLWYFHAAEEGSWNSIGSLFFTPPYKKVNRISVTPAMLLSFANSGKWGIPYPPHSIPKKRYDLLINRLLIIGFVVYLLYYYFIKA